MRLQTTDSLFPWDKLPDSPDLTALRFLLDLLPDHWLLTALREYRGKGRNDYPVHVLWRVHVTRYLLRHHTMEACLAELGRNPALRRVMGIEDGQAVPLAWNMSRFLEVLGQPPHLALLEAMFEELAQRLGSAVGDLGRDLAGDSAALSARKDPAPEGPLPQPNGGRKEYQDEDGRVTKVYAWFGYKFHLLVDVRHEVVVAWHVTPATASDARTLPVLLEKAQRVLPTRRMATLAYDKAADDQETHEQLHRHRIKPLIQNRALWKEEPERMLPGHDGNSNVVHDEAGTLYCYDRVSALPQVTEL